MPADLGRRLALGALVVVLAGVAFAQWRGGRTPQAAQQGSRSLARPTGALEAAGAGDVRVPAVALGRLARQGEAPGVSGRDPFRIRPVAPPTPIRPVGARGGVVSTPQAPPGPPPPPPRPPIPLRFVGLVRTGANRVRVAVLTDGVSVFYGKEGDIVDGRYRIVRLGDQTAVVAYLDGTGSTPLRLPGS